MKQTEITRLGLIKAAFTFKIEHLDRNGRIISVEEAKNIMPLVSLNYWINAAIKGGAQYSTLYLGLYDNNRTPVSGDTMTEIASDYGENQNYDGTERQTIVLPAVVNAAVDTLAAPNEFDFSGSGQTVRGAFISTSPTWGGATGVLISAVLFPSPKIIDTGETLRVPLGFAMVSA